MSGSQGNNPGKWMPQRLPTQAAQGSLLSRCSVMPAPQNKLFQSKFIAVISPGASRYTQMKARRCPALVWGMQQLCNSMVAFSPSGIASQPPPPGLCPHGCYPMLPQLA